MEKDWSGTCTPERGHRRRRSLEELGYPPWGVRVSPLSWSENQWDWQKGCNNPRLSAEECIHVCLLPKQGRGSRLKLPGTPTGFLWLPWHGLSLSPSDSTACWLEQLHSRKGGHSTEQPRPSRASEWGKNGHCWQWISSSLIWLVLRLPESVLWPIPSTHSDPSYQHRSPLG